VRVSRHDWPENCSGLNLVDVFCTLRVELLDKEFLVVYPGSLLLPVMVSVSEGGLGM